MSHRWVTGRQWDFHHCGGTLTSLDGSSPTCALYSYNKCGILCWGKGQPDPHAPPVLQSQNNCLGSEQVLGRAWPPEYPVRLYRTGCVQGQSLVSPQISPGVPKLSCHLLELMNRKYKTEPTNNDQMLQKWNRTPTDDLPACERRI